MKRSLATFLGLTLLAALVPVVAFASCAAADTQITLTDFDAEGEQIYVAVEGESPRETFTAVRRGLSCNDNRTVRVDYQLVSGTTGPPRLTVAGGNTGTLSLEAPPRSGGGSGNQASRAFEVNEDAGSRDVEHATIRLQNVGDAGLDQVGLGNPSQAEVFVVDPDGPTSFGFGRAAYFRQESFTLGIPVFRSGTLESSSIDFSTSPGTSNPSEGGDYEVLTDGPLVFGAGERVKVIEVRMLKDFADDPGETFTVGLEGGPVSATMGSTEVTIENLSGSGSLRPTGRLHHPKHRYKYPQNYPWLNEIHIFTASADRDLTVKRAEMSIVKKMKNGTCHWWDGEGFRKQRCIDRRWFSKGIRNPAKDYFLHKIKQRLPISVGKRSKVAGYEIRAKWWDNRNNVSSLRVGRNQNNFEVIRSTTACRRNPFNFRKCKPVRP